MPPKPLDILKKGLAKLEQNIKDKKDKLTTKLSRGERILASEEEWLDNEGNTIDEQCTLDILKSASSYEDAIEKLDEGGKAIVKKLRELAGDLVAVPGNKRKRVHFPKL